MFSTMDSQPEEWLLNDANVLHTLCFCCFHDSATAKEWVHKLVPRNQTGRFVKWSGGSGKGRNLKRRLQFIEAIDQNYDDIDFSVHCISSTEGEISLFAQAFYLENIDKITQELDDKHGNCLVLKISETKRVNLPVLRAAMLIWTYYAIKYMKEVNQLNGFIYSDWFSGDRPETGGDKALGVGIVNFLLKATGLDLQLSLPRDPDKAEADLLSDWFAGWSNSANNGSGDVDIKAKFDNVIGRDPKKIDWIRYAILPELPATANTAPS